MRFAHEVEAAGSFSKGNERTSKPDVLSLAGAGNEARTRYLHLGKVALYQMSYARIWCPEPESNQ